jgi:hypothetical protein
MLTFAQDLHGNTTPTYYELIDRYCQLDKENKEIELYNMGTSDYGLPIYLCILNGAGDSTKTFKKARFGTTVLINNAIHPGEPDGVNASLIWIEEWLKSTEKGAEFPVVAIIPAYNVGGMMNRSSTSRANQNGPAEYGFRGNASNLDLNRDCIKMDSENMFTFAKIYHALDPDVFMDTHVTNGADYQYTMTYISSVRERLPKKLGDLIHDSMIPDLEEGSKKRGFPLIPYVNLKKETPEEGLELFNDLPRYIMGYTSLFHSISFTLETHMLKPFPDRVESTLVFIDEVINWAADHSAEIETARIAAFLSDEQASHFALNYTLSEQQDSIWFLGYESGMESSSVTSQERLVYYQDRPYEKFVPFYKTYVPQDSVRVPDYYIVGRQEREIIERLKVNGVGFWVVKDFRTFGGEQIRIHSFDQPSKPYEGHYVHSSVLAYPEEVIVRAKPGDIVIPTNQKACRFLINCLEPQAPDSYFAWNFLDSYVQQKEYFSAYVFEEKAEELLKTDNELRLMFEKKKMDDPDFAGSRWQQLYFLYTKSPYYEPTHNILPVYRVFE